MDELSVLHTARNLPEVTLEDLSASRRALDRAIIGARTRTHARARVQRRVGWAFASVGIAATLTVGLVAADVTGFGGAPHGASAQAAEMLNSAAKTTIRTSDPVVGPTQYLRVDTLEISGNGTTDSGGTNIGYLSQRTRSLFVPASMQKNWVFVQSLPTVFQTFGTKSDAYARSSQALMHAGHGSAGEYYQGLKGNFQGRPDYTPASLATLPRDPQKLLAHWYAVDPGSGVSNDGKTFNLIVDVLTTGFVPADLRAALYEAAALIPGVGVTEHDATLDGRNGVSIGRTETKSSVRRDVIIDPTNGLVIGRRMVLLAGDDGYPAGTAIESTSVRTTVVDSAPTQAQTK